MATIAVRVGDAPAFEAFLAQRIYEFNAAATGYHDAELFTAAHESEYGTVEAGICGYTWGGCCFVSYLWVSEACRRKGLGSELLRAVENHALGKRCLLVLVSSHSSHEVEVRTGDTAQRVSVPPKATGRGSAVNGGEFLMLALATCYCNDLFREAQRLRIPIEGAEVEASADFPGIGLSATNIRYRATVQSPAPQAEIARLLQETDAVAEVHNTIRAGVAVEMIQR